MEWQSVESSTIARVSYEPHNMTLSVEFKNGVVYQYYDVPEVMYTDLLSAGSPGQYLAQHVKPAYRYARM